MVEAPEGRRCAWVVVEWIVIRQGDPLARRKSRKDRKSRKNRKSRKVGRAGIAGRAEEQEAPAQDPTRADYLPLPPFL